MGRIYPYTLYLLSCFLLGNPAHLIAQEVPKINLIEQISNSRCGSCAFRIPRMKANIEPFQEEFVLISYFASFPYSNCPFYQANTLLNNERVSFYSPPGAPAVYVNGSRQSQGDSILTQSYMRSISGLTSPLKIQVSTSNPDEASIEITNHNVPAGQSSYSLLVFLVEKTVQGGPLPSYQNHQNVARTSITQVNGDPITLPEQGESNTYVYPIPSVDPLGSGNFALIAFVQDDNKNVNNATISDLLTSSTRAHFQIEPLYFWPNPTKDFIFLKNMEDAGDLPYTVYDNQGIAVSSGKTQNNRISMKNLAPGMYHLTISHRGKIFKGTCVVAH